MNEATSKKPRPGIDSPGRQLSGGSPPRFEPGMTREAMEAEISKLTFEVNRRLAKDVPAPRRRPRRNFVAWHGDGFPVPDPYQMVAVKLRGGYPLTASAGRFDWKHTDADDDIVAFRLHYA